MLTSFNDDVCCGGGHAGICSVRNLKNISEELLEGRESVVGHANASTVMFIAPGPPSPPSTHVLYVGVTYSGNSPYRSEVPAVSSRSLHRQVSCSSLTETVVPNLVGLVTPATTPIGPAVWWCLFRTNFTYSFVQRRTMFAIEFFFSNPDGSRPFSARYPTHHPHRSTRLVMPC